MTTHTQGRLVVGTVAKLTICDAAGKFLPVARVTTPNGGGAEVRAEARENARRLVACWNLCEGISTEELESADPIGFHKNHAMLRCDELQAEADQFRALAKANGQVIIKTACELGDVKAQRDALLKAASILVKDIESCDEAGSLSGYDAYSSAMENMRAAIAKATGETA